MPLISALDDVDGAPRCILCAHETVCSGAADGYARMLQKPACTILHLGVGLANALANLHNAKRACSPVLNLVGTMAAWHAAADAPLASDVRALAEWCGACDVAVGADDCGPTVEQALLGIRDFEGGASRVTTVLLPHDAQRVPLTRLRGIDPMAEDDGGFEAALRLYPDYVNHAKACAAALSRGGAALVIGGSGLFDEEAFAALQKLEAATGCALVVQNNFSRCDRGGTRPRFIRVPYFPAAAKAFFASYNAVVCVGCKPPVAMFGYEDNISRVVDNALELDAMDLVGALNYLAKHVVPSAPASQVPPMARGDMDETGPLTAPVLCQVLAWLQPRTRIIVDESLTTGATYWDCSLIGGLPFTHLTLTGGAIGSGPCLAVGAAVACPHRRVVNFQADGSALYSTPALWCQSREGLDVTTIICKNDACRILDVERATQGLGVAALKSANASRLVGSFDRLGLARARLRRRGRFRETAVDLRMALAGRPRRRGLS